MYTSKCENILFSVDERGVATVTLNRPESLNALTWDMEKEIGDVLDYCSFAEEVRVVVLTGAGKHFCAGGDIKAFKKRIDAGEALPRTGVRYVAAAARAIRNCEKPVVAMINGAATGAGSALCFAADFRVGDAKTKIGAGFTSMGFSGDTNGFYTLSRLIGPARATEFYMLAQTLSADEAYKLGILNRLGEEGTLAEETEKLVNKLANMPTMALGFQKKMLNFTTYNDMPLVAEFEQNYMPQCSRSADHEEAVNAFLEKRAPKFIGK
ncbi:MAG: enoyl-CoA hydratase/isomerase family protein [Oscillospiraceae bacterium]|nr:enoyl-CoA hydratase/isomerase family protein [Oscillospiraceae bacterium]